MNTHADLPDAGQLTHFDLDLLAPSADEKELLTRLNDAPAVIGARDVPEEALKDLLAVLATLGIITDSTTTT